jgi:hypothetical protein
MHEDISSAVAKLKSAETAVRKALVKTQKHCKHSEVLHSNWRSSDWGPAFKARRLCLCCGLEEEAKHSGWGNNDSDFDHLKTRGFHKVVASHEIYNARFPQGSIDGPIDDGTDRRAHREPATPGAPRT